MIGVRFVLPSTTFVRVYVVYALAFLRLFLRLNAEKKSVIRETFTSALRADSSAWFPTANRWRRLTYIVTTALVARYVAPVWEVGLLMEVMQDQLAELGKAITSASGSLEREKRGRPDKRARIELPIDECADKLQDMMGLRESSLLPQREYPFSDNIAPAIEFRTAMSDHIPDKVSCEWEINVKDMELYADC